MKTNSLTQYLFSPPFLKFPGMVLLVRLAPSIWSLARPACARKAARHARHEHVTLQRMSRVRTAARDSDCVVNFRCFCVCVFVCVCVCVFVFVLHVCMLLWRMNHTRIYTEIICMLEIWNTSQDMCSATNASMHMCQHINAVPWPCCQQRWIALFAYSRPHNITPLQGIFIWFDLIWF